MSEERIVRHSAAELRKLAGKHSKTDVGRLRRMTEEELDAAIAEDPDADLPGGWADKVEAVMPVPKKLLSVRLDTDVVDWFKAHGPGYQTRMNAVLRSFMEHKVKRRAG